MNFPNMNGKTQYIYTIYSKFLINTRLVILILKNMEIPWDSNGLKNSMEQSRINLAQFSTIFFFDNKNVRFQLHTSTVIWRAFHWLRLWSEQFDVTKYLNCPFPEYSSFETFHKSHKCITLMELCHREIKFGISIDCSYIFNYCSFIAHKYSKTAH